MQRKTTTLIDDLDGSDAAKTVRFAVDGKAYEIDLSDLNAARFAEMFAELTARARKTGGRGVRRAGGDGRPRTQADRDRAAAIRAWAVDRGLTEPGARGRLPVEVTRAYYRAADEARTALAAKLSGSQ